jgi:hypothetical protein
MRELRVSLGDKQNQRDATPRSAGILYLASLLRACPAWLNQYWAETAELMAECIGAGESVSVLKGIGVMLDSVTD